MKLTPQELLTLPPDDIKRRLEDGDGDDFEGIRALSAKEAAERLDLFRQIAGWDRWEDERLNRRRENITVGVTFAAVVGFAAYCFQLDVNAGIGALLFPGLCYWTGKTFAEDTAARWFARMRERENRGLVPDQTPIMREREGQQPKPSPRVKPPRQPPPKGDSS